jgi:quinoprotein glucose dehydrogenase
MVIVLLLVLLGGVAVAGLYGYRPGTGASATLPVVMDRGSVEATGWPTYGGDAGGAKYSSLDQIGRKNVAELQVAWTFHSGDVRERSATSNPTTSEVTPILANNKLYLCTPLSNVIALDPATGKQIWRHDFPKVPADTMTGVNNCRGVSYWQASDQAEAAGVCGKRILEATDTGALIAVDAETGRACEDFGEQGQVDLNALDYSGDGRISVTSPPAIFGDVAIVGGSVADNQLLNTLDGIVRGFDVRTGAERWSWNPIPSHLTKRVGGANAWAPLSVDIKRGWVFLPTGSPSFDTYGVNRSDPIPDGNAVVVLDALTGRKIWSFQTVHHDLWDYDLASMPTLATIKHKGKMVEAVIQATKMGYIFVLDRETGKPLFPVEERTVPKSDIPGEKASPTQPVPLLPAPVAAQTLTADDAWGALGFDKSKCRDMIAGLRNEGIYTTPSVRGSLLYPAFLGGTNWGGIAYDPASGLAVVNSSDLAMSVTLVPRGTFDKKVDAPPGTASYPMTGSPYVMTRRPLLSPVGAPCNPPPWGRLTAIDMTTGKTRWQVPFGRAELGGGITSLPSWGAFNQGGPIITGGGLIFIGASLDARFRAFDLATGAELWSAALPAPATATPMTYSAGADGRQYVVVAAGGHASLKTKLSDAIIAYALPRD